MRTIKARSEFERVFRQGHRAKTPLFIAIIASHDSQRDQDGRVAFAAGKKLGNAVFRNRCKRVMREGARRASAPWRGFDVILLAKGKVATATPSEVDSAFATLRKKLALGLAGGDGRHER